MGEKTCSICFEEIDTTILKAYRGILSCKHEFHPMCILNWFETKTSCPLCRNEHNKNDSITNIISIRRDNIRSRALIGPESDEGDHMVRIVFQGNRNVSLTTRRIRPNSGVRRSLTNMLNNIGRGEEENESGENEENEENENEFSQTEININNIV